MFLEWFMIVSLIFAYGSGIKILPRIAWGPPRLESVYTVGIDVFHYLKKIQEDRARRRGSNELYLDRLNEIDYSSSLLKAGFGGKIALLIIEVTGSGSLSDELKKARVFYFYMFFVAIAHLIVAYLIGVPSIIQRYF